MLDISLFPAPGPLGPLPPPPPPETGVGDEEDVVREEGDEKREEEGMGVGMVGKVGGIVVTGTECVPHVSSKVFFM